MATQVPTDFEDLTTCSICLDTFTRPKVLPCQHSYCYACLMLLSKDKSSITCPYCQKVHQIPASGVAGFSDHVLLNNLVGMSLPKTEVCSDCGRRPSVDGCEHCSRGLCHKCLLEHTKLSMELKFSLGQLKNNLTATIPEDIKVKFETLRTNLETERSKMNETLRSEALNKLIEAKTLLERANSMDNLMRTISELYEILDSNEKDTKTEDYASQTLRQIKGCTTVDSLKDMKNYVTDLEMLLRFIRIKNEDFKFRYSTSSLDEAVEIQCGQDVLNLRGRIQAENFVELITQFLQDSAELLTKDMGATCSPRADHVADTYQTRADRMTIRCEPRKDHVADAYQTRADHMTTTCEPRADYVAAQPTPPRSADAKTETEERFLLPKPKSKKKKKKKSRQNYESKNSAAEFNRRFPYKAPDHDHRDGSFTRFAASTPHTAVEGAAIQKSQQNGLPRNVDYASKGKGGDVMVIGEGELSYPLGCAHHVDRNEILVADMGNRRIVAYSADGKSDRVFYQSEVEGIQSLAVSSDGKHVYMAAEHSLIKTDMDGKMVKTLENFSVGTFRTCCAVTCFKEFTIVVDADRKCIVLFDIADEEVKCFGIEHLIRPRSVAVSEDGTFYVTDTGDWLEGIGNPCVMVFDRNGNFSSTFAKTSGDDYKWGVVVDGDGNVLVSRPESSRLDVYSPQRKLISSISDPDAGRDIESKPADDLGCPHGICFMPDGRLIVADGFYHRVQIF